MCTFRIFSLGSNYLLVAFPPQTPRKYLQVLLRYSWAQLPGPEEISTMVPVGAGPSSSAWYRDVYTSSTRGQK